MIRPKSGSITFAFVKLYGGEVAFFRNSPSVGIWEKPATTGLSDRCDRYTQFWGRQFPACPAGNDLWRQVDPGMLKHLSEPARGWRKILEGR